MPKRKLRRRPAPPTVALDDAALARGARRVIAFRQAHGTRRGGRRYPMTQEALARRARVSAGCLAGFENGRRRTGVPRMRRIAEACGLTLEQLVAPEPATGVPELADEAIMIARLYALAETDLRVAVRNRLCLYLERRRDAAAVETVTALKSAGAWPAIPRPTPISDRHSRLLAAVYAKLPTLGEEQLGAIAGLVLAAELESAEAPPPRAVNHGRE